MADCLDFKECEERQSYSKWLEEIGNIKVKLNNLHIAEDEKERLRKRLSELEALVQKKHKSQRILPY